MTTLAGARVTSLFCTIPPSGAWWAVVAPETSAPGPGPASLVIGDLALRGVVLAQRGGDDAPGSSPVVVVGGAGWRSLLPPASYRSPQGVRFVTVIADLARACAEPIDLPADKLIGQSYVRLGGRSGSEVLSELVRGNCISTWRVAPSGRTRFDAWPALGAADAHGRVESRDLVRGLRRVAVDAAASAFLPGATLEGTRIARTTYREDAGELRVEASES